MYTIYIYIDYLVNGTCYIQLMDINLKPSQANTP